MGTARLTDNARLLEAREKAFDEKIVDPTAAPVHRDAHSGLDPNGGEGRACELAAWSG